MRSGVLTKLLASRLSTAMPAVLKSLKNPHKSAVFILFIVSGYFLVEDAFNVHCKYMTLRLHLLDELDFSHSFAWSFFVWRKRMTYTSCMVAEGLRLVFFCLLKYLKLCVEYSTRVFHWPSIN